MNYRVRHRATLDVTMSSVWETLTDYAAYPAWVPSVTSCEILAREGGVAILEVSRSFRDESVILEVVESAPEFQLAFAEVGKLSGERASGGVLIEAGDRGVDLIIDLTFRRPFYRRFSKRLWRFALSEKVSALQTRSRRLASGEVGSSLGVRTKVLEVFSKPEGLELRIGSDSYWLESR